MEVDDASFVPDLLAPWESLVTSVAILWPGDLQHQVCLGEGRLVSSPAVRSLQGVGNGCEKSQ